MSTPATASKGAATRELILDRALEITHAKGLDALTIGTLAEAAGMSKSGVFAHFGSREELQLSVLEAAAQIFTQEVFVPAVREAAPAPAHVLGRIGTVTEIAEAFEYLICAEWTTGSVLTVDGGLGLGVTNA